MKTENDLQLSELIMLTTITLSPFVILILLLWLA